jgi:hypothetical protein
MKRILAGVLAAAVIFPAIAGAQIKTVPGETITATATVTAIDSATRLVTLKKANGEMVFVVAPPEIKRFSEIKVGDTITAKYTENMTLRVMKPGEPAVNSATGGVSAGTGANPSGTISAQRSVTATITAIDPAAPSITLSAPDKQVYTAKVADREALKQVKVGDRLDITFQAAVLVAADPAKK